MAKRVSLFLTFLLITSLLFFMLEQGGYLNKILKRQDQPSQFEPTKATEISTSLIPTRADAPYRLHNSFDVLGYKVIQLEHTQENQGFFLLEGTSQAMIASVFNKNAENTEKTMAGLVEPIANSLLLIKNPKNPDHFYLDTFEFQESGELHIEGQSIPFRRIKLAMHTQKRKTPKLLELFLGTFHKTHKPLIAISYSGEGQLRPELFKAFLKEVLITP